MLLAGYSRQLERFQSGTSTQLVPLPRDARTIPPNPIRTIVVVQSAPAKTAHRRTYKALAPKMRCCGESLLERDVSLEEVCAGIAWPSTGAHTARPWGSESLHKVQTRVPLSARGRDSSMMQSALRADAGEPARPGVYGGKLSAGGFLRTSACKPFTIEQDGLTWTLRQGSNALPRSTTVMPVGFRVPLQERASQEERDEHAVWLSAVSKNLSRPSPMNDQRRRNYYLWASLARKMLESRFPKLDGFVDTLEVQGDREDVLKRILRQRLPKVESTLRKDFGKKSTSR